MLDVPQLCSVCQESKTTRGTRELFLKAVSVWINKPHVVNRRLCGSTVLQVRRCQTKTEAEEALIELNKPCTESPEDSTSWEAGHSFKELSEEKFSYSVIVRELVPKSEFFPRLQEAVVYDKEKASVTFFPLNVGSKHKETEKVLPTKELSYVIQFNEIDKEMPGWARVNEVTLAWSCDHQSTENPRCQVTSEWLRSKLLSKVASWSEVNDITTSATSLLLVAVDKYKDTYIRLKNKYGRDLVKNWPERTDPKKFVYEDVAIAAYLLLIWEEDRQRKGLKEKQSFVDLGCGNGLLVYILTKEGHKGLGIDLRKRKIWDMFGPDVNLREEAIKPSSEHLFPDYDWLIGNHSDELTPWIPVIAARSSPTCSFFVLPCCHHDFVGKFSDTKKGQSRYGTYMDYVKEIVECCGFSPEIDTLRIPSTKRICLMGRQRTYTPEKEEEADIRRQAFIDKRTLLSQHKHGRLERTSSSSWEPSSAEASLNADHSSQGSNLESSDCFADHRPDLFLPVKIFSRLDSLDSGLGSLDSGSDSNPLTPVDHKIVSPFNGVQKNAGNFKRGLQEITSPVGNGTILPDASCADVNHAATKRMRTGSSSEPAPAVARHPPEVKWAQHFQPRSEPGVRNCQRVPEEIKSQIVNVVFGRILESGVDGSEVLLPEGKCWRKGGAVKLSDVVALFDKATLKELKAECGGLQTLLRNHSHVFQVNGGQVSLRDFSQADPWKGCNPYKRQANIARAEQRDTRKTTLCWFNEHHPDGCPRMSSECSFAHGQGELRKKLNQGPLQAQSQEIMVQ